MNFTSLKLIRKKAWSFTETTVNKIVFWKDRLNKLVLSSESPTAPYEFSLDDELTTINHGRYQYQAFLDDELVSSGVVDVLPNLEFDDPRGEWTIIYENLMGAYKKLSSREADTVTIYDGTSVSYTDRDTLIKQIRFAEQKMNTELGMRVNKKITTRFY